MATGARSTGDSWSESESDSELKLGETFSLILSDLRAKVPFGDSFARLVTGLNVGRGIGGTAGGLLRLFPSGSVDAGA